MLFMHTSISGSYEPHISYLIGASSKKAFSHHLLSAIYSAELEAMHVYTVHNRIDRPKSAITFCISKATKNRRELSNCNFLRKVIKFASIDFLNAQKESALIEWYNYLRTKESCTSQHLIQEITWAWQRVLIINSPTEKHHRLHTFLERGTMSLFHLPHPQWNVYVNTKQKHQQLHTCISGYHLDCGFVSRKEE